jgi:cytochrome b6-f complex iron-sulfur subunit
MERRKFLGWVGVGTVAGSLPWAIAACAPASNPSATAPAASPQAAAEGFTDLGAISQLDGGSLLVKDGVPKPVMVIRSPDGTGAALAVNPTCTHNGCQVAWSAGDKQFVCPCHSARFGSDGAVVSGPAQSPLPVYESKVEGDRILVKIS